MTVSANIEALLRLFHEDLAEVRFPGLDTAVLAAAAAKLRDAEAEVQRAALALEAAQATQRDAGAALAGKAQRALAYARIYAEDHPALRARLDALDALDAPVAAADAQPAARRRGRPPKAAEPPALFLGEAPAV